MEVFHCEYHIFIYLKSLGKALSYIHKVYLVLGFLLLFYF